MIWLLFGCGGANEETLVDQLRVMAVVVEPPEAAPGTTAAVTTYVADPLDEAPESLQWTCTNLGDGCLEAAEEGQGTTVDAPSGGTVETARFVSPALAGVVADGTTVLPIPFWTLVCADGLCPAIDQARTGSDADALSSFLADPIEGAKDLPLFGTSLALGFVRVGQRPEPLQNPVITPGFDAVEVAVDGSVELTFSVDFAGVATAWGYTTAGGFDMTDYLVEDGEVTLTWIGAEEAGAADLWVVVVGEEGGSAVWTGSGTIK